MKTEPDDNAFATPAVYGDEERGTRHEHAEFGLSKREYVAAKIMAGFAAYPPARDVDAQEQAESAVRWADALITALNVNNPDA